MDKVKKKKQTQVSDAELRLVLKLISSKYPVEKRDTFGKLADLITKHINKEVSEDRVYEYYRPSIEFEDRYLIAKEHWPGDENVVY